VPRESNSLPLNLPVPEPGINLYRWLYEAVRKSILQGHLRPGDRLPATRDLARAYELSRATIVTAFEQLKAEGYVVGRPGSGTYVTSILPEHLLNVQSSTRPLRALRPSFRFSDYARRLKPFRAPRPRTLHAFRPNQPALDQFPATLWAQVATRRLRRVSANLLAGGEALGYLPLREVVANYLNTSRGVQCVADQVLIVSGAQEGLDRTARLFLNPGQSVWMESPGYPGAVAVFRALGAKISPIPVDAEGLNVRAGLNSDQTPRVVYVTPAHQFPTGATMSLRRRLEFLAWARHSGAIIFEDDYDSEYRYSGRPIPALQGMDRSGSVIFAGSFSAVMFPALRLGYLVVPADLVDRFAAAASVSTHHPPLQEQAILCDFMTEGHFARHIRRMRELYAERLNVLLEAAENRLAGLVDISKVEAGLQTVGWLRGRFGAERAADLARQRNVELVPLKQYAWGAADPRAVVLGFAAVDPREITRGVEELVWVLEKIGRERQPQLRD
jgi:GntR family transcriptional regulator / MocR family aminotransferase